MKALAIVMLATFIATPSRAEEQTAVTATGGQSAHTDHSATLSPVCSDAKPQCARTVEPVFAKDGRLWVAFSVGDKVYAAASRDEGKSFEPAVTVAAVAGAVIDANGEARPKIVALRDGALVVSYTARPEKSYNGAISIARSTDGGRSFSTPQAMIDGDGQRFAVFVASPRGRLYAAWLDKRDADEAKRAGKEFAGSGIAVGWSDNGGKTFAGKKILMDHSCECCRVSATLDRDGRPVFAWRNVFENNSRDHYAAKLSADGTQLTGGRVSEDDWATTCPHHGPSIAIDGSGAWHVVWFTNGKARKGLFYARSVDGGKSFSEPAKFADDAHSPSHAAVLAVKNQIYRVWKEFDGTTTTISMQSSRDAGRAWSDPLVIASTTSASDHPQLIEHKGVVYLSWLTREQGYRMSPLPNGAARAKSAAVVKQ